jgi:transcriptional regulator with PAS, ATPase and Fis domain
MALLTHRGSVIQKHEVLVIVRERPDLVRPLRAVERAHVESALILCGGNRQLTAKRLQVSLATVQRWVRKFREEDNA